MSVSTKDVREFGAPLSASRAVTAVVLLILQEGKIDFLIPHSARLPTVSGLQGLIFRLVPQAHPFAQACSMSSLVVIWTASFSGVACAAGSVLQVSRHSLQ